MFVFAVVLRWHICGLTLYVCVRSGVMVAYLYFKNSGKMESKSDDGAVAILRANCLRFAGVFSYRYLRSDVTQTNKQTNKQNTHTQNTIFPTYSLYTTTWRSVNQTFLPADPFRLRKTTTGPYNFAHVNIVCPDGRSSKLKIYFTEQSLRR